MDDTLYEKLLAAGLKFVSYRPRSQRELTSFLQNKLVRWKTAGSVSVAKAIDRLRELGYVNDTNFARWWIDQRIQFRQKGKRAITAELLEKGISREVIAEVFDGLEKSEDGFDELANARKILQKKLAFWSKLPIIEQKKKMYTYLAQRGFSGETIRKLIDETSKKSYN